MKWLIPGILLLTLLMPYPASATMPPTIIQDVVAWGAPHFPIESWSLNLIAGKEMVNAAWTANSDTGMSAVANYIVQSGTWEAATPAELSEIINDEWLTGEYAAYESWEETERCMSEDYLLIEATIVFNDKDYVAREWISQPEEGYFEKVFIMYDLEHQKEFNVLAETLFPDLMRCADL